MFITASAFSRAPSPMVAAKRFDPLRPNERTISRTDPSGPEQASIIWYRLEDLRRQRSEAQKDLERCTERVPVLELAIQALEAAVPTKENTDKLANARLELADCHVRIKMAHDTIRESEREIDRQIACLRQLHVNYDAKSGRFTTESNDDTVDVLDLVLTFLNELYRESRRHERQKNVGKHPGTALNDLMALLGGTVDAPNGTGEPPETEDPDRRVRAWVKTSYSVSGANGGPAKVFTAYAPVTARAAEVGADHVLATTLESGIRGGWSAHETISSQQQALLSVVR